jgi:2-hydroxychromene-2-carboxylate isomerase
MNVEFHFDFGSGNAYFPHKLIPAIEARTGATFTYMPILLGGLFKLTNNQSPMAAFAHVKNKLEYQGLEIVRFMKKHNLPNWRRNPHFPVNTLQIMRGAIAAEMEGVLKPYADAMFAGVWEEGLKLDEPEVIAQTITKAGLDAKKLMEMSQLPEVKAKLIANTESSAARGAFGSPSFFIGNEMWFGKDALRDLEEEILARR